MCIELRARIFLPHNVIVELSRDETKYFKTRNFYNVLSLKRKFLDGH
jgi:hypothetical protein